MSEERSSLYDLNLADRQRDEVEVEDGTLISTYLSISQLDEVSKELSITANRWAPEKFPFASVSRDGTELRMANVYGDGPKNTGSALIHLRGSHAGWYSEWGSGGGRGVHKGPLGLLKDAFPHIPVLEHAKEILERYGGRIPSCLVNGSAKKHGSIPYTSPPVLLDQDAVRKAALLDRARKELERCTAISGTDVETYLVNRGVFGIGVTNDIFALADAYNPAINLVQCAMVSRYRDIGGQYTGGIHRTFIQPGGVWHDGKRMLGPTTGYNDIPGCVFLSPIGSDGRHGFGTGIESTLAAMKMYEVSGWAVSSDAHLDVLSKWIISNKHLVDSTQLSLVKQAVIFADSGESGMKSAKYLGNAFESINIPYTICVPRGGDDFCDDLNKGLMPLPVIDSAVISPGVTNGLDPYPLPPPIDNAGGGEVVPTVAECEAAIEGLKDANLNVISNIMEMIARARCDPMTLDVLLTKLAKKSKIKKPAIESSYKLKLKDLGIGSGVMLNANNNNIVIPSWYSDIVRWENDEPKPIMFNCIIGFSDEVWQGVLWYNEYTDCIVLRKPPPYQGDDQFKERMWDGHDTIKSLHWMQQRGLNCTKDHVMDAAGYVAVRFNPIVEYFTSLIWDGVPRLDTWLHKYLGCDDNEYHTAIGSKWMIGAVARVYEPGCKFDSALILEGIQGVGKSEVFHIIGGKWFTDDVDQLGTKDCAMQIHGAWIVEMAELSSMTYSDVNKAKAFITRQVDKFRPPYGREVRDFPRMNAFAGTVNGMEYLKDDTGGRRFWPASVKFVAKRELEADRDQLIAEAIHRYLLDEKWWLDNPDVIEVATEEQESRMTSDPWLASIDNYVSDASRVSRQGFYVTELLEHALLISDKTKWTQRESRRAVACLRQLGFTDERRPGKRDGKNRLRMYCSPIRTEKFADDPIRKARQQSDTPKAPEGGEYEKPEGTE
jgi:predicted P-loop ATPase